MNMIDALVKRIMKALEAKDSKATSAYDTSAVVTRISGKTAWVHIDGGMPETPVNLSIDCKKGDTVRVRLSGGDAYLVGNDTRPPTDDARAVVAEQKATTALQNAAAIKEIAEKALKGDMENAEAFAQAVMEINEDIEGLREQIDGNITSWFYSVDPALDRPPVATDPSDPDNTGWDTDEKKNNHLGDLYYNVDTGKVWRFVFTEGAYSWSAIEDSDVTRALEMASRAQDTADSKRRVFVTTPTPPYDVGDLWSQGSGGDLLRCAQAKTSAGTYSRNDWVLATKYTDDSALNVWIAGEFASTVQELENGITDAKVETYYQSADPSTNWTAAQKTEHAGDFWYNTTSEKYYRWSGSAWQEVTATPPDAVFDRIDGKATIYVGSTTPSSPQKGDLWLKSATDDILTYVNGNWVKYNKYTDDTRANAAYTLAGNALTSANGKNKVYHQATQPSGGTYISGDTWFDTDDGYKMYTYDGSSWVAEQFGDAAIADLSITNAKIANGTIQSAKIQGLDVGKLTGGYIDASHINAAEISIGQSQVTGLVADLASKADSADVPTAVSDLTNDSGFQNAAQVESAITSKGYQTAAQVSSAITTGISGKADKTGTVTATVSVYYRSTSSTAPSKPTSSTTIGTSATTDNAWEYVMPQPKRDMYFYTCERYTYADGSIGYSTVRALASETYASKYVSSNDNTYIDGGRLYANSVTADKIVTSGITIAQSQVTDLTTALAGKASTSSVPTKVSQLTNDSSFATTTQVGTAKSEAISTASTDATNKANAAQSAAISAAATDATTKANAAAQTATSYIQADSNGIKIAKTVGSATSYSYIDADGMKVYKGGALKATFGDSAVFQTVYNGTTYSLTLSEGYVQTGSSTYRTGSLIKSSGGLYINSDEQIMLRSPSFGLLPPVAGTTSITLDGDTEVRGTLDTVKVVASGAIYANNHDSAIGAGVSGSVRSSLALASGTAKYLATLQLLEGVWIVIGEVRFPSASSGACRLNISSTSDSAAIDFQQALGSVQTHAQVVKLLTPSTDTTYYLNAYQNSGSRLTASNVSIVARRIQ